MSMDCEKCRHRTECNDDWREATCEQFLELMRRKYGQMENREDKADKDSVNRKCADCEYFDDVTSLIFGIKDKGYCTKDYCYEMRDVNQKCVVCENKKETDESERTN